MEQIEEMERLYKLIGYGAQRLQGEHCVDLQATLDAARDWAALGFEELFSRPPAKSEQHLVVRASVAAMHTRLQQEAPEFGLLYTFGYTMPFADALIEQLVALGVTIADIRYSANSRAAKWREARLRERLGDHYIRIQELGNVNYNRAGSIQLSRPEAGIRLAGDRLQQGQHLAFMCVCSTVDGCHRQLAAELMHVHIPALTILHL